MVATSFSLPSTAQQHGFIHAGMITTALDSACGYASVAITIWRAKLVRT
jgi:acyl-coenzyme A thioesterase PaaI-like protein